MDDLKAGAIARQALRSYLSGKLDEGGFTPLLRRGLALFLERIAPDERRRSDDVEWASCELRDTKSFSDLRASLYGITIAGKPMIELIATDSDGLVCDFACAEDVMRVGLPYLRENAGLQKNPWHQVSGLSAYCKIQALIPGSHGFRLSGRRLGEPFDATIEISPRQFQALSPTGLAVLLDDLTSIARNECRLMFGPIRPSALHLIVARSAAGADGKRGDVSVPPREHWVADRHIDIPA